MSQKRHPITIKLPPELLDDVDAYCAAQAVPPTRTAVIEAAIVAFIAGKPSANSAAHNSDVRRRRRC